MKKQIGSFKISYSEIHIILIYLWGKKTSEATNAIQHLMQGFDVDYFIQIIFLKRTVFYFPSW